MKKISVSLSGHQTSITLEPEFIETLNKIATSQNTSVASIISSIDTTRTPETNLSSAVRVWVLKWVIEHK
jgi:predicted DNA-binding ribbon-helix-helix protein